MKQEKILPIVIVGHVDHGKSSLIGRLLFETESLPAGKQEEIRKISEKRGMDMEWSFVLDSFQAERDQAITIDTTQIWFKTDKRNYVIIDAPGHREFLKNMISGAASAEAAILVVDAKEGVREQTRRHAYLLHLLGLRQIIVAVNKMDLVGYDQNRFQEVVTEAKAYFAELGLEASAFVPISARAGDNLMDNSVNMSWWSSGSLLEHLEGFRPQAALQDKALRFPVQDVYRFGDERIIAGRVESGTLHQGDMLFFSPSGEKARVKEIRSWPDQDGAVSVTSGNVCGITLDQPIFVERGHMASSEVMKDAPMLSNVFRCHLFWLSAKELVTGNVYKLRIATQEVLATVQSVEKVIDTQNLGSQDKTALGKNDVGEVIFRTRDVIPLDSYADNRLTGRCVIYDGFDVAGGGILNMDGYPDQRLTYIERPKNIFTVEHLIGHEERARRNGHYGGIFWFTGLSGAGKSTLAMYAERALFEKGYNTYVLDGDNVRHGLNKDLGFSPEDRAENIRRIGEVAALQADAGLVTVTAFISPYRADRQRARDVAPHLFHEIYVKADLETCEQRDPKDLYKKARAGKIKEFTGISSPYEPPENPDLVVDTQNSSIEDCVSQVIAYIEAHIALQEAGVAKAASHA